MKNYKLGRGNTWLDISIIKKIIWRIIGWSWDSYMFSWGTINLQQEFDIVKAQVQQQMHSIESSVASIFFQSGTILWQVILKIILWIGLAAATEKVETCFQRICFV